MISCMYVSADHQEQGWQHPNRQYKVSQTNAHRQIIE